MDPIPLLCLSHRRGVPLRAPPCLKEARPSEGKETVKEHLAKMSYVKL